jgi:hypothetical protein
VHESQLEKQAIPSARQGVAKSMPRFDCNVGYGNFDCALRITQFSQSTIKECIERRLDRVVIMTILCR